MFLSGDAHLSELTRLQPEGLYPLYDFTSSPLTAGPTRRDDLEFGNPGRVPGTLVRGRSFGMIDVIGASGDRRLTLAAHDVAGNELWRHEIHQRELTFEAVPRPLAEGTAIEEEEIEEIEVEMGGAAEQPDEAELAPPELPPTEAAPAPPPPQ
jgi:hypothetical protein